MAVKVSSAGGDAWPDQWCPQQTAVPSLSHGAGVARAAADGGEGPARRRCLAERIASPADRSAVLSQGAVVVPAAADGGEGPARRRLIVSPADCGAVLSQGAGVNRAAADGDDASRAAIVRVHLRHCRGRRHEE